MDLATILTDGHDTGRRDHLRLEGDELLRCARDLQISNSGVIKLMTSLESARGADYWMVDVTIE